MANNEIHWGEGLFLRPHHFQLAQRHLQNSLRLAENWNVGYPYGVRKIEIDEEALGNWRLSISTCHVRLHDGSHIRCPEDASLAPISIPREPFAKQDARVPVHLAVPRLQMGLSNASANPSDDCRYGVHLMEVEDENAPGNSQQIEIRRPNARLIVGNSEEVAGYDALPLLRLRLGAVADAPPEIDTDYIPPVLACDGWPMLQQLITEIYDYLSASAERLAQRMTDHGVSFESGGRADLELILKLQTINASLGCLAQLSFARGVHPFAAYCELCRIVGLGAIFQRDRRIPTIPQYDHDDLGTCFRAIKRLLIPKDAAPSYVKRPFIGEGLQLRVRLERAWLESGWSFHVGVHSNLSFSEVQSLLDVQSRAFIDFKMGASEDVDAIYRSAKYGVLFTPEPDAPKIFPHANWSYFRVDRNSEPWKRVEETLNLAVRVNELLVMGKIDQEEKLTLRHPTTGTPISLSFAIFAMPTRPTT